MAKPAPVRPYTGGTVFPTGVGGGSTGKGSGVSGMSKQTPGRSGSGYGGNPLIDGLLGLLGGGGGGGGGGSYYGGFDGTAARQAAQGGYDRALGNTKNVYGQINNEIVERVPAIQAAYAKATGDIKNDAAARSDADAARAAERDRRNLATAAAQGLTIAQPTDSIADGVQAAGQAAYQRDAQAWEGFNNATQLTALERNTATGDTFKYAGNKAEEALGGYLQQALAQIAAMEASNPGGYSGGGGGGGGGGSDLSIYKQLMSYDIANKKATAANAPTGIAAISSKGWGAINNAYAGGASTKAQVAQALAKSGNQRDLAYWLGG